MQSNKKICFVECQNPECNLRFPLDLTLFKGSFCSLCGSTLTIGPSRLTQSDLPKPKTSPVLLSGLLDNIRSGYNVGSIFRSSDGAGLQKLYLCGITPTPIQSQEIAKTALGSQESLSWEYHANAVRLVKRLKQSGVLILVLECTSTAKMLFKFNLPVGQPSLLVVGNEPSGVYPELIDLANEVLYIPMIGSKNSLNVSVAFGIAAYQLAFGNEG